MPRAPDQHPRDDAAHQGNLFGHLDDPVDGASNTAAIFAGAEEEGPEEKGDPEGEEEEEKGVLSSACAEGEILGAKRSFEDEKVEVGGGYMG